MSLRKFFFLVFLMSFAWFVATAIGGIIELESASYWRDTIQPFLKTPIALWILFAILPLIFVVGLRVGVSISKKFQVKAGDMDNDGVNKSSNSTMGELLSLRTSLKDGARTKEDASTKEETPSVSSFASIVILRLNEGRISEKAAKTLINEFELDIGIISNGIYTLTSKLASK